MKLPNFLRSYCSKNGHVYSTPDGGYTREYAPQKGDEVFLVTICMNCGKDKPKKEAN